jgi:hypothetical protein
MNFRVLGKYLRWFRQAKIVNLEVLIYLINRNQAWIDTLRLEFTYGKQMGQKETSRRQNKRILEGIRVFISLSLSAR